MNPIGDIASTDLFRRCKSECQAGTMRAFKSKVDQGRFPTHVARLRIVANSNETIIDVS